MDFITFYNRSGKPIAYISEKDNETIYLFDGNAVAYIYGNCVYSFRGKFLGLYENGFIYDKQGYCVFFTENATGGPVKPSRQFKPVRSTEKSKPIKSVRDIKPISPVKKSSWSTIDHFF